MLDFAVKVIKSKSLPICALCFYWYYHSLLSHFHQMFPFRVCCRRCRDTRRWAWCYIYDVISGRISPDISDLWQGIIDLQLVSQVLKQWQKNTSHGNEVLVQDTTHLIQRQCYQGGSPCQDPAGNWTAGRPPDHWKEMQTAVVWSCLPFFRSGQNHLAWHSERGEKTGQAREVGRQHQGMDRPGVR